MKKFIILISILTPSYGLYAEVLKPPCSNFFSQTERRPSSEQSANEMIQALMDYSGEPKEAPWIQETIQFTKEKIRIEYPDSTEMQAILKFLEEKIGDKDQLLKVLKSSTRFLIRLRKNSLNTHLQPLFKTLEDIFGQDIVLNKLKQSLQITQLKIEKTKQIIDILKGQIPISIFEDQRVFEIKLTLNDEEIKNLFIKNLNIYIFSLKNFTDSTSLRTGEYQKGTIQILWPFIKAFIKANLTTEEKNSLHLESDINRKTTETIGKLLNQSSDLFIIKSSTITEFLNTLTGKEKLLVTLNNETTLLDLDFKDDEIGQFILERRMKFLRNNRKKLQSNIEILWPFIEALKRRDLESQRDRNINQDNTINKALAIKNFFAQAPQGFTTSSTSLNDLVETLTGKKSISFQSDEEIITFELNFEDHKIGELILKDTQGFSQVNQQKLEFTIKTLWPSIRAFTKENLKFQKDLEINQENIKDETIKLIEEAIFQSIQGFSPSLKSFKNLVEVLKGKIPISFQSNEKTITFELNFKDHEIGYLFLKDPQGFSQISQQKLELSVKTLWPFIEALSEKNLKSQQRNSEISQESIRNETVKLIKKAIFQSIKGFSITPEHLNNIIDILRGKIPISFQSDKKTITFGLNFEDHKIGYLFLKDPIGIFQVHQQKLEFTIKALWPFMEALSEKNLKSQQDLEISQKDIRNETIKLIKKAILQSFQGFSPNIKFFTNLIEILKGKKNISFQSDGQMIKLTFKLEGHKIAELFLGNPQGFAKKGSQNLEKVFQNLWPSLKGDPTIIMNKKNNLNQIRNPKLIKKAFTNQNLNSL